MGKVAALGQVPGDDEMRGRAVDSPRPSKRCAREGGHGACRTSERSHAHVKWAWRPRAAGGSQ